MIRDIAPKPADPLLKVMKAFREDPRTDKIDLGVGVYKDESGLTPIMTAVKEAEARLHVAQKTKNYVGQQGDVEFLNLLGELSFAGKARELVSIQSVGGTGALRLGFDLLAASGAKNVVVPAPTWPNHPALIRAAGLKQTDVVFFDVAQQRIDLDALLAAIAKTEPGDAVLLQGCCHNPLGADFSIEQWAALAEAIAQRGAVAFLDMAYQGFGKGIEADAAGVRLVLERVPEAIVSVSCAKNFGLYRERVGALYVSVPAPARAAVQSNLFAIARANYSMPPDHGAALVRDVLKDAQLKAQWRAELDEIRAHIKGKRAALAAARINMPMHVIGAQNGMFSTLPLTPTQIETLRATHGVYMTDAARINVAGLQHATLGRFVEALAGVAGA